MKGSGEPSAANRDSWPGLLGHAIARVGESDTAEVLGSGDVHVLGTPRLIALMEAATIEALRGVLPAGETTVGTAINVVHRRPTPVGAEVVASARVTSVDGKKIHFEVSADHVLPTGERVEGIGRGTVTRAVVSREDFAG